VLVSDLFQQLEGEWWREDRDGQLPARRIFRGQNPEGYQACRFAGGATDEVWVRDKSQTVQQIGLTISPEVLARANRLIKWGQKTARRCQDWTDFSIDQGFGWPVSTDRPSGIPWDDF